MDVIYQDRRIFVCLKPAGVLSTDEPGGMPERIRAYLGDDTACVRTVHRLDAAVAGVMVFARSRAAASILSQQVREHTFRKEYLAVVHGSLPQSDTLEDLLLRDKAARKTCVVSAPGKDVQPARLSYIRLDEKTVPEVSESPLSFLKIRLETGRTHQIRAQFSSRGRPLFGDRKYGEPSDPDEVPIALWSYRLSFCHPETGERMTFTHLPPDESPWDLFSAPLPLLQTE